MSFDGRVLIIGLGGVSQCTLPLLFTELGIEPSRFTVLDFADVGDHARWVQDQGATFVSGRITPENVDEMMGRLMEPGGIVVDLAWNIDTMSMLEWCRAHDVRFVNASIELWDPYEGFGSEPPQDRTLYVRHMALRRMIARWGDNDGPTAVLDHGANPGLVSHFTKAALEDIADAWVADDGAGGEAGERVEDARRRGAFAELAHLLGVKVVHISERDTQISSRPKEENEFVNTWSVEGFHEEGIAPAEMGWGTHEKTLPPGAHVHRSGPLNQICLARPGCHTWVRSWVPCGEIVGMVIRHGEAFSISDRLTVRSDEGEPVYRPTVHYAYCPADAAVASLHELHMRRYELQDRRRIMTDDIVEGRDELGCLLMGHPFKSWWIGSLLDIHESRRLVPHQNATTLQVAASVLAAVKWMMENPRAGVRLPDDLPHDYILDVAKPYLGPLVSTPVDWTPLDSWVDPFAGYGRPRPPAEDVWQFTTFLV
ncbi:MAG TPA: saccharopine dehydrogenase C-terminal domain-containing protein [Acidimicrobiales bacterium]|nr:saccharopine dehydrogenase C-terminal domain-containing protein [Acidimicrobiales bacterium]